MIERHTRSLFRHPLAAVGGALVLPGGALFFLLLLLDFSSGGDNPYRALVTFVIVPALVTLGLALFFIAIWLQVRQGKRTGEPVKFSLSIDPTDRGNWRNLWLFLLLTAGMVLVVLYSGFRAYEATDSVRFCGETCHEVMEPQAVTYANSAHAKVPCVKCHIGPGATFFVQSKIDGLRQVVATMRNSFDRPIKTPVHTLRPAQEVCEQCHWPQQFYGNKLVSHTYFRSDEENSPWTISLMVKIGGGNPRTGQLEGIHWHMVTSNKIEYIAADEKRQDIIWVRQISLEGDTTIYIDPLAEPVDPAGADVEVRTFDCIDCHNRPSHRFLPPAMLLNLALSNGDIARDLPWVRSQGLELLNAEYATREQANAAITAGLAHYYQSEHPDLYESRQDDIDQATRTLLRMYNENFFPEMKTDYRVRENNLSHFVNDGCFRCHDNQMASADGKLLTNACSTCHVIVAQGPAVDKGALESSLAGLEFQHPEDIDEAWREYKCTECHTPESGY